MQIELLLPGSPAAALVPGPGGGGVGERFQLWFLRTQLPSYRGLEEGKASLVVQTVKNPSAVQETGV